MLTFQNLSNTIKNCVMKCLWLATHIRAPVRYMKKYDNQSHLWHTAHSSFCAPQNLEALTSSLKSSLRTFLRRATSMTCHGATWSCMWILSLLIRLLDTQCSRTCPLLPSNWDQHSVLQHLLQTTKQHQNLGSSTFPPPHATVNWSHTSLHLWVLHLVSPKSRNQRCSWGMTPLNSMDSSCTAKWCSNHNHCDSCLKVHASYGLGRIWQIWCDSGSNIS
jgi:hypothetical protein